MKPLTARQLEVLELLSKGLTNPEIGGVLEIAQSTVKRHVEAILEALEVANRTEAASAYHAMRGSSPERAEAAGAGFRERPAVAVLPFDTVGAPEDDPRAELLVEDLIHLLSSWRWFPVIASASTAVYRGKPIDLALVGRELTVRYVVQGTLRVAGDRMRVDARLVDTSSGEQVFSGRHEARSAEAYLLEDELAERIAIALEPALERVEWRRAAEQAGGDPSAYQLVQQGYFVGLRRTKETLVEAQELFRRAIALDPNSAAAHLGLGGSHLFAVLFLWSDDIQASIAQALESGRRTVAIDDQNFLAHQLLGMALAFSGESEAAIPCLERAVELNPSAPIACFGLGSVLRTKERVAESIELLEWAIRISPRDLMLREFLAVLSTSYLLAGRYEDALARAEELRRLVPESPQAYDLLSASLGYLERKEEAEAAVKRLFELRPFSLEMVRILNPPDVVDALVEGWRKAGVPGLDEASTTS